jgi:8-oxo-dGTP pyrophosphatase MutT (NUDIX family)
MWVFPGGKVDPGDWVAGDDEIAAGRNAAVREAAEEAGVTIDPSSLVVLSYWLPPPEAARRFSTWFFVASVVGADPIVLSEDEVGAHRWQRPVDTLAAHAAGEVQLAPPTWMTLQWLTAWPTVDAALAGAASRDPEHYLTHAAMTTSGELAATVWEGDVAYEDLDIDPTRPGPRRRMEVGPDGWILLLDPVPGQP